MGLSKPCRLKRICPPDGSVLVNTFNPYEINLAHPLLYNTIPRVIPPGNLKINWQLVIPIVNRLYSYSVWQGQHWLYRVRVGSPRFCVRHRKRGCSENRANKTWSTLLLCRGEPRLRHRYLFFRYPNGYREWNQARHVNSPLDCLGIHPIDKGNENTKLPVYTCISRWNNRGTAQCRVLRKVLPA